MIPLESSRQYRPDIDGLRALAVASVVLFHVNAWPFSGGYVGVDVFFVVSGYLITGIVLSDVAAGQFSIARFYERRARRILPALFVMLAVSSILAVVLFIPPDLVAFAKSAAATVAFSSNFLFQAQAGYFDAAAELKPLLHTWSLGIEEQFYLLHPLFLRALVPFGRSGIIWGLAIVLVASFVASAATLHAFTSGAFYLLYSRAWELGVGSLLAVVRRPLPRAWAPAAGLLGLALIAFAVFAYSSETPFPGAAALPPVLGTALIIWAGRDGGTIVSRVLSWRPLVAVGLISYSLYLWHWPAIVFAQYDLGRPLTGPEGLVIIAGSVVLALLTYRYVEQPARKRQISTRSLAISMSSVAAGVLAMTALVIATRGLPQRMEPETMEILASDMERVPLPCVAPDITLRNGDKVCQYGAPGAEPTVLLAGDSHGSMIAPAFFRSAAREGFAGFKITDVGFCPLPDVTSPRFPDFSRPMPDFIELLKRTPSIRHVVVACFWEMHADGYSRRLKRVEFRDSGYDGSGVAYNPTSLRHGLERLFDMFPDRQFALIEDVPTGPEFDPNTAARLIHVKGGQSLESLGISRRKYDGQLSPYRSIFAAMAARPNVRVYSVADSLCTADFCPGWRGGRPAYRDFDHISETGALVLSGVFEKVLSDFAAPPRGESRHADITRVHRP